MCSSSTAHLEDSCDCCNRKNKRKTIKGRIGKVLCMPNVRSIVYLHLSNVLFPLVRIIFILLFVLFK